jgi:CRP-like cAMP-binding protein
MEELLSYSFRKHTALTAGELDSILSQCKKTAYKKGHFIVREGDVSRNGIFILKGLVRSYFIDINGHEHIIQLGMEGWWVGDLESFTNQIPGKLYVEVIEDSIVLLLPYEHLQHIYATIPAVERYFRILFQNAFAAFHKRMLENLSMDAEHRYIAFRDSHAEMDQRIPQKHIASYLGMSAEFLSKIKKRLMLKSKRKF